MMWLADAATPAEFGAQQLLSAAASATVFGAIVTGIFLVAQVLLNKRLRTPADRLAEIQLSVKVYQDQVLEARADKEMNENTIRTLREYVTKVEEDGRKDAELINTLYRQIREVEERNSAKDAKIADLQRRIDRIADKLNRGEPITMRDLMPDAPRDTVITGPIHVQ